MAKCPVSRKRSYSTEEAAIAAALKLSDDSLSQRHPPSVYRCPDCGDLHVGHHSRKRKGEPLIACVAPSATTPAARCQLNCKKAGRELVTTPKGTFLCCESHAKRVKRAYELEEHEP